MAAKKYISVFHPNPDKSLAIRQQSIDVAYNLHLDGVRFNIQPRYLAPTRATRDYSYLSDQFDYVLPRGLNVLLNMAYGPQGGDWAGSDEKIIAAADLASAVTACLDGLNYIINTKAFSEDKLIAEMWNEPDNTNFGAASGGVFLPANVDFFNLLAPAIRSAYPNLKQASPSFSYTSSGGIHWTETVTTTNCSVSATHWQYYDYISLHLYLQVSSSVPAKGPQFIKKLVNESIDNFKAALRTVPASAWLINKPIAVTEFGFDFNNSGLNQQYWYYGNEAERSRFIMECYNTLAGRSDIILVNFYSATLPSSAYEARNDTQHYGLTTLAGNAYHIYQEVAKATNTTISALPGSGSLIESS